MPVFKGVLKAEKQGRDRVKMHKGRVWQGDTNQNEHITAHIPVAFSFFMGYIGCDCKCIRKFMQEE